MEDLELAVSGCLKTVLPPFPEHLPEKTPLPAIVYQRKGGKTNNTVCDDDYTADFKITIYAKTMSERAQLVKKVRQALRDGGFEQDAAPVYSFDFYSKAHAAVLFYLVDEQ